MKFSKILFVSFKVNRGCASLAANRILTDCVQNVSGPSEQHIPLRVYHTADLNTMEISSMK